MGMTSSGGFSLKASYSNSLSSLVLEIVSLKKARPTLGATVKIALSVTEMSMKIPRSPRIRTTVLLSTKIPWWGTFIKTLDGRVSGLKTPTGLYGKNDVSFSVGTSS